MNKNYKLCKDSDLSEDQIEADVAAYLGYVTPFWNSRYRLKSVNEQLTGADKLFDRFIPLYLQFKVSEGLKPLNFNFNLSKPNLPLQGIRDFRRKNSINADPTLYFRLRNKAATATDFQHNILLSLHNPPTQYAFYIAPLTLSISEYNESLNVSIFNRFMRSNPFEFRNESRFTNIGNKTIGLAPFLRGHVSITPHEIVNTADHYYSYSKGGTNIAWHSGEKLKGDFRLSTQLQNIFETSDLYRYEGINKKDFLEYIKYFTDRNKLPIDLSSDNTDYIINDFAQFLKEVYNIKLMFLGIDNIR